MTDTLIFSKQIDDVLSGRANRDTVLILGDVPRMYLPFGVPHFKLAMTQRTLHKIITKHNLDIGIIKRLPALLKKPIFVFQSATEPNALVVVIDATDKDKNAVIVIIHPDRQHQQHRINRIASVYSKPGAVIFGLSAPKGKWRTINRKLKIVLVFLLKNLPEHSILIRLG